MTRIRTREQLRALYPEHYEVLLGYWMSGMNEKEHLDRFVETLKARRSQRRKPGRLAPPSWSPLYPFLGDGAEYGKARRTPPPKR